MKKKQHFKKQYYLFTCVWNGVSVPKMTIRSFEKGTFPEIVMDELEDWVSSLIGARIDRFITYNYKKISMPSEEKWLDKWNKSCIAYEKMCYDREVLRQIKWELNRKDNG